MLQGKMQGPFTFYQNPQCANPTFSLWAAPHSHGACRGSGSRGHWIPVRMHSLQWWIMCTKCPDRKKHAEKVCKTTSTSISPLGTFKMVIFQVKLSTAFCSFRSFRPSLVPMLCRCSWNSMAGRDKKTKQMTSPSFSQAELTSQQYFIF